MIRPEAVLRDLRRGERVRRAWAPEAVDELVARGSVRVYRGVVLPPKHSRARERDDRVRARLALGQATTPELAALLGVGLQGASVVARRVGAVSALEVRTRVDGRRGVVAVWRLA